MSFVSQIRAPFLRDDRNNGGGIFYESNRDGKWRAVNKKSGGGKLKLKNVKFNDGPISSFDSRVTNIYKRMHARISSENLFFSDSKAEDSKIFVRS